MAIQTINKSFLQIQLLYYTTTLKTILEPWAVWVCKTHSEVQLIEYQCKEKKEVNAQFLKIHHHLFAKLWFFCQCKKRFVNSQFWQMTLKMTGKSLQLSGLLSIIGRQLGVSKSNLTWKWVSFHTRRSKSLWIFECHEMSKTNFRGMRTNLRWLQSIRS